MLIFPIWPGAGYVDYHIPVLPLLAGRYQISAAVVDRTMLHTYDHHDRIYRLVVQSDGLNERYGTIAIPAEWAWQAGGAGRQRRRATASAHTAHLQQILLVAVVMSKVDHDVSCFMSGRPTNAYRGIDDT